MPTKSFPAYSVLSSCSNPSLNLYLIKRVVIGVLRPVSLKRDGTYYKVVL